MVLWSAALTLTGAISFCSTARAFEYGTALSFVSPEEESRLAKVEERLRAEEG